MNYDGTYMIICNEEEECTYGVKVSNGDRSTIVNNNATVNSGNIIDRGSNWILLEGYGWHDTAYCTDGAGIKPSMQWSNTYAGNSFTEYQKLYYSYSDELRELELTTGNETVVSTNIGFDSSPHCVLNDVNGLGLMVFADGVAYTERIEIKS